MKIILTINWRLSKWSQINFVSALVKIKNTWDSELLHPLIITGEKTESFTHVWVKSVFFPSWPEWICGFGVGGKTTKSIWTLVDLHKLKNTPINLWVSAVLCSPSWHCSWENLSTCRHFNRISDVNLGIFKKTCLHDCGFMTHDKWQQQICVCLHVKMLFPSLSGTDSAGEILNRFTVI